MTNSLILHVGQYTLAGNKTTNEDSCGIQIPPPPLLTTKGIAAVIADGVSGSEAGKEASDACVQGFLNDYFSTPESWSVKTSVEKVLTALNRWLHGRGQSLYGTPQGMVTTLSAAVIKSATAHLFHVGDTRIYRLTDGVLECLTRDHRVRVTAEKEYLSRAMGIDLLLDIDYRSVVVKRDDIFLLTTDGVHDFMNPEQMKSLLIQNPGDPETAAREIVEQALANGSDDNLTCQVLGIERIQNENDNDFYRLLTELPFPPPLDAGMILDGYQIIREQHASKRTQIYLAVDTETDEKVILKTPSINYEDDPDYIDQFLHEEWAGRRIQNQHVLKVLEPHRQRHFLYYVTEHIEGQNLRQWMYDHPRPTLTEVRNIIEQVAAGLRAFHRMEMIHQDLKPENILIDSHGTAKIIDFGSTKIAGIEEISTPLERNNLLSTVNYTAPEYHQGYSGTDRSDLFSLGIIAYEMLTGRYPFREMISARTANRLTYQSALRYNPEVPSWIDGALEKAVHNNPKKRYAALSEFVYDLSHPNPALIKMEPVPLLQRNPTGFWRGMSLILLALNLIFLYLLMK